MCIRDRPKLALVYDWGARKSAKIAIRHSSTITTPPVTASLLRSRRRRASRHRLEPRDAVRGRTTAPGCGRLVSDAGVESAIEEVDDEVHQGEERAVDQHDRHDHRVVAVSYTHLTLPTS